MKGAAASLALIIAIAVATSLLIITHGTGNHPAARDVVAGRVVSVNHVLNQVVVNGTVIKFAGTWRCTGVKGNLTAPQLLNMIRPGEVIEVIATHGILSLKAVKAYLPGGTVCYLAGKG